MNRKAASIGMILPGIVLFLMIDSAFVSGTTLSISRTNPKFFKIDGVETRLLGVSYFAPLALDTSNALKLNLLRQDLDKLKSYGFNCIRVWASWWNYSHNRSESVLNQAGTSVKEPYMSRLKTILLECDARGMIVDVTVDRVSDAACPRNQPEHLAWATTMASQLINYRNLYFDIANEWTSGGAIPKTDLRLLIQAVHTVDPTRLCSASTTKKILDVANWGSFIRNNLDFVLLHGTAQFEQYFNGLLNADMPIHMNETPRRGNLAKDDTRFPNPSCLTNCCPSAGCLWGQLCLADNHGQGVAGWIYHNGRNFIDLPNDVCDCRANIGDGGDFECFHLDYDHGLLLSGGPQRADGEYGQLDSVERAFIYTYGPMYWGW